MSGSARVGKRIAAAGLAILAAACTIEDTSEKRAADSAAAATANSNGSVQTSASPGTVASPQTAPCRARARRTARQSLRVRPREPHLLAVRRWPEAPGGGLLGRANPPPAAST